MKEGYGAIETKPYSDESVEQGRSASSSSSTSSSISRNENGKASLHQTVINMIKMCCGTGILALPFATNDAGLLFHPLGLTLVTIWNIYSTDCLLRSYDCMTQYYWYCFEKGTKQRSRQTSLLSGFSIDSSSGSENLSYDQDSDDDNDDDELDRNGQRSNTDTFGNIAYFAFGKWGLNVMDALIFILMMGIIICYEDAMVGFIGNTPFTLGNKYADACGMLLMLIPLASLSDFSIIARVSAMGFLLILFIFVIIGMYGIQENGFQGFTEISEQRIWPKDMSGFSSWYGVVSFSYGTIPFTFNLKESMNNPTQMMQATKISLWSIMGVYFIIGELMVIVFWPSIHGIDSDVTKVLPQDTLVSYFVGLSMTMVVLFSTPLVIVPCGDFIMKKLGLDRIASLRTSSSSSSSSFFLITERSIGVVVRISICIVCAIISLSVPNFVYVLSFVGCLCVSIIAYTYPPLAHMQCTNKLSSITGEIESSFGRMSIDCLALLVGLVSSILTSFMTFQVMMEKIQSV